MAPTVPQPPSDKVPDFRVTVEQSLAGVYDANSWAKFGEGATGWLLDAIGRVLSFLFGITGWAAGQFIRGVAKALELADPAFGEIAKAGIEALFGVSIPAGSLTKIGGVGGSEQVKGAVGQAMLRAITGLAGDGGGGSTEPSMGPAEKYLGTIGNFAIEGWLMGFLVEVESLGRLKEFGELKDVIAESFGFGRLTRRILNPAIKALIADPMERAINLTYRPNLFSAGEVAKQLTRGRMTRDAAVRELALQGWNDTRIEGLLNDAAKFHGVSDLTLFVRAGYWTQDQAVQHLRDQGWEEAAAADELLVETLKLDESYALQQANAAVDAYVAGRVDHGALNGLLADSGVHNVHLKPLHDLALLRRELRTKELTSNEVEECVRAGVLAVVDYRAALERDGYSPAAVIAKELLLRAQMDKAKDVADHRAELEAERAGEKAIKDKAAELKRQQVEADRALQRRGSFAELSRAAVRGLIPIARVQEVLAADYDADTVDIMLGLVDVDRQAYLAQQQQAADAKQRATNRGLSVADLEQGVLSGAITMDQYAQGLTFRQIPAADAAILVATLQAKLDDQTRAQASRNAAALAAANRGIDLTRYESLVRHGVRTLTQYDALLQSMGFSDAARADMDELLRLRIADDEKARQIRKIPVPAAQQRGLTLDQERRAVILGLATEDEFVSFLVDQNYTADAQVLLVGELRVDVADAEAARAKRESTPPAVDGRVLALSTVARAARLSLISPDVYQERLIAAGYTADDVAIEMELLFTEIADVQSARQQQDQADALPQGKGLTLSDLARAVRRGLKHLEDYRARAVELGLSADAVDTLTRVLADELRETTAAKDRRTQIDSELSARNLSLSALDARVLSGEWTIAQYVAALVETGYEAVDAELLGSLLPDILEDQAAAPLEG